MRIITDEAELKSCKLGELLGPVKKYLSQDEADLMKAAKIDDDRRALAIDYYKKYIEKAAKEAGEDPEALKKESSKEVKEEVKVEAKEKVVTPHVKPPEVNETELVDNKIPGLELTDYLSCVIRDMPGKNGTSTQSVETLLELAFRFPNGRIIFGRPGNINKPKAKAFIALIQNCKKVRGMHNITEENKTRVIKNIRAANLITK